MPNLMDPNKADVKGKNSLFDVLDNMFDVKSRSIRTCQPAIVVEVDAERSLVTVQPLIRTQTDNSGKVEVRDDVQYEVPIQFPSAQSGAARLTFPVQKDTVGVVHYCERNRDNWLNSDGKTLQNSSNYNGVGMDGKLSPLYFVPEIFTPSQNIPFDKDNVVLKYNTSEFKITPLGLITLTNNVFTTTYDNTELTSTNGVISSTLNSDGSGEISNTLGSIKIETNGNINLNGVIITPSGSVTLPSGQTLTSTNVNGTNFSASDSLTVDGEEMKEHVHPAGDLLDGDSNPCTGNTGAPNA